MIDVRPAVPADATHIAEMAVALTEEISQQIGAGRYGLDAGVSARLCAERLAQGSYFAFLALRDGTPVGFVGLSEGCSLYAGGSIGTIQELYVAPAARSDRVGTALLDAVGTLARERDWRRLEVCTPPLPEFARSLAFYEREGFEITGGRKLKKLV
jgi:GNAT superfamily N-acetyltransferase